MPFDTTPDPARMPGLTATTITSFREEADIPTITHDGRTTAAPHEASHKRYELYWIRLRQSSPRPMSGRELFDRLAEIVPGAKVQMKDGDPPFVDNALLQSTALALRGYGVLKATGGGTYLTQTYEVLDGPFPGFVDVSEGSEAYNAYLARESKRELEMAERDAQAKYKNSPHAVEARMRDEWADQRIEAAVAPLRAELAEIREALAELRAFLTVNS